jgi:hypothetical protein
VRAIRSLFPVSLLGLISIGSSVSVGTTFTATAQAQPRPGCSQDLKHRTPAEVIDEHIALIQAGNIDQAMCDYGDDASVILPGQVIKGLDNIHAGLISFAQLFGGATPTVHSVTTDGPVVMLTFSVFGPQLSIPNGSDTYVVEKGLIRFQTVHDEIVPTAP